MHVFILKPIDQHFHFLSIWSEVVPWINPFNLSSPISREIDHPNRSVHRSPHSLDKQQPANQPTNQPTKNLNPKTQQTYGSTNNQPTNLPPKSVGHIATPTSRTVIWTSRLHRKLTSGRKPGEVKSQEKLSWIKSKLYKYNEGPQPRSQKCLFLRPQKQAPCRARLPELGLCSQDSMHWAATSAAWDWRPRVAGARMVLAETLL